MTATEELRRLLDERGVEHYDRFDVTEWVGSDGEICHTSAIYSNRATVLVLRKCTTPEQAIAATLGAGTCKLESAHAYWDPYVRTAYQIELSCHTLDAWDDPVPPSYCPYCGKRVVEVDA
jgi:hypothetical protein